MKVFILANCRKPELWPATEMVFESLRIGFPTAEVHIYADTRTIRLQQIVDLCRSVDGTLHLCQLEHPTFVGNLLSEAARGCDAPFYLCDTDQIMWDSMEGFTFEDETLAFGGSALAGRFVPQFRCEFTNCFTMPRLHTSLLYVNPPVLRKLLEFHRGTFPQTVYTPSVDLFSPAVVPGIGFYDGAAMLYATVGGYSFTERELDCYDHLQCGCISDIVGPHISDGKMQERHKMIFENPQLLKGQWKRDESWFKERAA